MFKVLALVSVAIMCVYAADDAATSTIAEPTTTTIKDIIDTTTTTTPKTTTTTTTKTTKKYTFEIIKMYKVINNFFNYLQPGYNNKLGLQIAHSTTSSVPLSNIIEYILTDYEQKGASDEDKFVVLRFEASLAYICLNHCAEFYTSLVPNHDCVFAFEDIENDTDSDDTPVIMSKFMGVNERRMYIEFGKGYYKVTRTKNEKRMVLFKRAVAGGHTAPDMLEVLDEVNDDECAYNLLEVSTEKKDENTDKMVKKAMEIDSSVLTLSSVIIGCVTVVILVTGSVLIVFFVLYFKNKNNN